MAEHFGGDSLRGIFPSTTPALLLGLVDEEGINQAARVKAARLAQERPQEEQKCPHHAVGGAVACASELPRSKNHLTNLFLLCSGDLSLRSWSQKEGKGD